MAMARYIQGRYS